MTRKEAINRWVVPAIKNTWNEKKCDEIIEALEQEPCDDAISRQAAINLIESIETERLNGNVELIYAPAIKGLRALLPVMSQPKTGHWIDKTHQSACGVVFYRIECSKCGEPSGLSHTLAKYCPWCGARMVEPQESEVEK